MSDTPFTVPSLTDRGAYEDHRGRYSGYAGYKWRADRKLSSITKVFIHHTASTPVNNLAREIDSIYNSHVNKNAWGGIGYHFIVSSEEKNGFAKVAYVGDIGTLRAHTAALYQYREEIPSIPKGRANEVGIGIAIVGQLHKKDATDAQLRSIHELVKEIIFGEDQRLPGIKSWEDMIAHYQVDATRCPGLLWTRDKLSTIKTPPPMSQPKPKVPDLPTPQPQPKPDDRNEKLLEKDAEIKSLKGKLEECSNKGDLKDDIFEQLQKKYANAVNDKEEGTQKLSAAESLIQTQDDQLNALHEQNTNLTKKVRDLEIELNVHVKEEGHKYSVPKIVKSIFSVFMRKHRGIFRDAHRDE